VSTEDSVLKAHHSAGLSPRVALARHACRYARGLARTADRVGLVLCNDLSTAVRIVMASAAPGAENELIDFALSDEYAKARAALGLSICV